MRLAALVCALGSLGLIRGVPVPGRGKFLRNDTMVEGLQEVKLQAETIRVRIREHLNKLKPPNIRIVEDLTDTPIRGIRSVLEMLGTFIRLLHCLPADQVRKLQDDVPTLRTHLQHMAARMRCAEAEVSRGLEPLLEKITLHPFTGTIFVLDRLQTYLTRLLTHLNQLKSC